MLALRVDGRPGGLDRHRDHARHVERLGPQLDLAAHHARDVEQVVDQADEMLHLPLDHRVQALVVGVGGVPQLQQVHGGADGRQGVAQLMGEQGEEVVLLPVGESQRLLGGAARGDVEHRTEHQRRPPARLTRGHDPAAHHHPSNRAVRVHESELLRKWPSGFGCPSRGVAHPGPVLAMDPRADVIELDRANRRKATDLTRPLVRFHPGGIGAPAPRSEPRNVERQTRPLFMQTPLLLGDVTLVDVLDHRDEAFRLTSVADERRHGRMHPHCPAIGALAAKIPGEFCPVAVGNLLQRGMELRRIVAMEQVAAPRAEQGLGTSAGDGRQPLIDMHEPAVEGHACDAHGGLPEHRLQLLALA